MGDKEPKSTKPNLPGEKDDIERAVNPREDDVASSPPITESVLDELLATIDGEILKFIGMVDKGKQPAAQEPTGEPTTEDATAELEQVEPLSVEPQAEEDLDEAQDQDTVPVTPVAADLEELVPGEEGGDEEIAAGDSEEQEERVGETGEQEPSVPETASEEEIPREPMVIAGEAETILDELVASIDEELQRSAELDFSAAGAAQRETRVGDEEQHIIFTLADTEYAVPSRNIMEVGEVLGITSLPNVPPWLLGVANLRGDIISMVDLRDFFGLEQSVYHHQDRMLVARADNEEVVVGLVVDRVSAIRFLSKEHILETTAPLEDKVAPYLRGVIAHEERTLAVLDFEKLLLSPEMQQFQPA